MTPNVPTTSSLCDTSACVEVVQWRKSSRSYAGDCVEMAVAGDKILVRDSKNPDGDVLSFTPDEWRAFIGGVRLGEFDL